jgi:hypothetical protein
MVAPSIGISFRTGLFIFCLALILELVLTS